MGIDTDLIVSVELGKENSSCSICTDLIENAAVLKCGHSFCAKCLRGLYEIPRKKKNKNGKFSEYFEIKNSARCPDCRCKFNPSTAIDTPGLFMRNQLALTKLKCQFHPRGCGKVVEYNLFGTHTKGFSFNPDFMVTCEHCEVEHKKTHTRQHNIDCISFLQYIYTKSPILKDRGNDSNCY